MERNANNNGSTNMSAYHFGLGNGKVSEREQRRVQRALRAAGLKSVEFVAVDAVGVGTRYWFEAPNRGEPFDGNTARAALAAVGHIKTQRANGQYR